MPQFDFYSYFGQVCCVLFGFCSFYFFVLNYYLAHFSEILKFRTKLIQKLYSNKTVKRSNINILHSHLIKTFN
jgi:hypothetical protein